MTVNEQKQEMIPAKTHLSRLFTLDGEIESLRKNQMELIQQTVRRPTISDMKVQSSGGKDIWVQIGDYALIIQKKIEKQLVAKLIISRQIDRVQDDVSRQILRYRYPIGMTWEQIAKILCYDIRWVHRLHGRALLEFEKDCPNFLEEYEHAIKSHTT